MFSTNSSLGKKIIMETFTGVFNVQEEVGERGAYISAFNVQPDVAIVLEGTICADMPNISKDFKSYRNRKRTCYFYNG